MSQRSSPAVTACRASSTTWCRERIRRASSIGDRKSRTSAPWSALRISCVNTTPSKPEHSPKEIKYLRLMYKHRDAHSHENTAGNGKHLSCAVRWIVFRAVQIHLRAAARSAVHAERFLLQLF